MWFFSSRKARRTSTKSSSRPSFRPRVRALEDRCLMSAGMLDSTFNPTGSPPGVAVAPNAAALAYTTLVQPSGKIVVAGGTTAVMLAEFDPNGSLDSSFGSGGVVTTTKGGAPSSATAGVLYPTGGSGDQKILLVGPGNNGSTFALVRYNADGSLDTSFNRNGIVDTSFKQGSSSTSWPFVVLVPNGSSPKIVVARSDSSGAGVELVRYNADGSLDTSFGSKGTAYVPVPGGGISSHGLVRDPVSGDLIVGSHAGQLVALTSTGSLDTSFGTQGVLNTGIQSLDGVAVDSVGGILAGGYSIARCSPTGVLDTSWGGTGIVPVNGWRLAIQPDGKVLANTGWGLYRLNTDGSLDSSFGINGYTTAGLGSGFSVGVSVALAPNGDIVLGGDAEESAFGPDYFAAARFLPSEPEIGSFTANQVMAGGPVTLTASNITDGNPNSSISQVSFFYYDSSGNKIVVGTVTSPDGSGNWTLSVTLPPGSYTLYAQATDSYGVLGDPLAYSLTVQ